MIAIVSDHAGYSFKERIKDLLNSTNIEFVDLGTHSNDPCDYPDYAQAAAKAILEGKYEKGIAVCGTGIGMSIAFNRFKGIRATLCTDEDMARSSRSHNDSNVLVLAERITPWIIIEKMIKTWLSTEFEGGRHKKRIEKIDNF